jgi:hypothetical protein
MKNSIFTIILLVVFFISCDTDERKNRKVEYNQILSISDTVNFKIPFSSSNQPQYMQYKLIGNKEFLAIGNKNNYSIEVFDFINFEVIHKYRLPTSGPYDIKYPQMFGFFIKNWDSVFVGSYDRPYFLLLNRHSEITDAVNFYDRKSNPKFLTRAPLSMYKGALLASSAPISGFTKNYWRNYIFSKISFKNKIAKNFYMPELEDTYNLYGAFHIHQSYCLNTSDDQLVSNFSFDPNLYVYDLRSNSIVKSISIPSKHFHHIPIWRAEYDKTDNSDQDFYIQNPSYKSILYDKWRDVYYRFAERGVELKDVEGNFNTWYDKKPSIIILNSEFEIIGETDLPQSIYRISDAIVGKDGLYVATNNDKNPNYNENVLTFHVYELSDTKNK